MSGTVRRAARRVNDNHHSLLNGCVDVSISGRALGAESGENQRGPRSRLGVAGEVLGGDDQLFPVLPLHGEGDVTDLRSTNVGNGFRLVLDTGTFHGLDPEQRSAMGREVTAIAAGDDVSHGFDRYTWPTPMSMRSVDAECEAAYPKSRPGHVAIELVDGRVLLDRIPVRQREDDLEDLGRDRFPAGSEELRIRAAHDGDCAANVGEPLVRARSEALVAPLQAVVGQHRAHVGDLHAEVVAPLLLVDVGDAFLGRFVEPSTGAKMSSLVTPYWTMSFWPVRVLNRSRPTGALRISSLNGVGAVGLSRPFPGALAGGDFLAVTSSPRGQVAKKVSRKSKKSKGKKKK